MWYFGVDKENTKGEKRINEDPWDFRLLEHAALFYCAMFSEILSHQCVVFNNWCFYAYIDGYSFDRGLC